MILGSISAYRVPADCPITEDADVKTTLSATLLAVPAVVTMGEVATEPVSI
jgi:hypothetical protein